jgi:TonB family protein
MKKLSLSVSLILLLAGLAFSQTFRGPEIPFRHRLKGTVTDQTSAVYSGITLYFKSERGSDAVSANINGKFETDLLAGKYTVTVNKINSESFIAYLNIEENGLNPNDVEFIVDSSNANCDGPAAKSCPKILNSVKAAYPPAARAVRADGEVVIGVKIDKEGKVVSASTESGHPLLRSTSMTAARGFLFEVSDSADTREVRLTFVFMGGMKETEGVRRYSNPYRIEINPSVTIDF